LPGIEESRIDKEGRIKERAGRLQSIALYARQHVQMDKDIGIC